MDAVVGTQLYGWGQVYQARGWDLSERLDEVLAAVQECGYETAEGFLRAADPDAGAGEERFDRDSGQRRGPDPGRLGREADSGGGRAPGPRFAARLQAHGLRPVSLYAGGAFHEREQADRTIDTLLAAAPRAVTAGFTVLDVNPDPIGRDKTDAELATQAAALERLGSGLRALGMRLGVHNHDPEMRSGAREFHHNLQRTTPGNVGLCLDTHWCYRGGADPLVLLEQYAGRIVSLHLRQSIDGVWSEDLGDGDIDYRPFAAFLRGIAFSGPLLVELAIERGTPQTRDVVDNHRRSRDYVRRIFGV